LASVDAQRFAWLFDMVQVADARQGFQLHGTGIGLVQIEKLAACVRPATQFNTSWRAVKNKAL
jgi:hypothetical protein